MRDLIESSVGPDIIAERITEQMAQGFWYTSDGERMDVDKNTVHGEYLMDHPEEFGIDQEQIQQLKEVAEYQDEINAGMITLALLEGNVRVRSESGRRGATFVEGTKRGINRVFDQLMEDDPDRKYFVDVVGQVNPSSVKDYVEPPRESYGPLSLEEFMNQFG